MAIASSKAGGAQPSLMFCYRKRTYSWGTGMRNLSHNADTSAQSVASTSYPV
jgi:hypothetical protein